MRLKIKLQKEQFELPIAYRSILQGIIYGLLSKTELGHKYHDEGFVNGKKVFKCFTFSDLFGKYEIKDKKIVFEKDFYFYIASQDEQFMQALYQTLLNNNYLMIYKALVEIRELSFQQLKPFTGNKTVILKTLSPVLVYSTSDNYSTYYQPSNKMAQELIYKNLVDKANAYGYPIYEPIFSIEEVLFEKRRMIKFKNCVYRCYLAEIKVNVNFETLLFIYNCGLSSKNSCGFGMVDVRYEESHLPI